MLASQFASIMALLLIGQGQGDALHTITPGEYWKAKHVVVSKETMIQELNPVAVKVDISQPLADLSSSDYSTRKAAKAKIEAAGVGAKEQLEKVVSGSGEPEITIFAKDLLKRYQESEKAGNIRKLMAIRTLEESKEKGALPALQGLTGSPEPFVAEYAKHAITTIEGKPWQVTLDAAALDADVWMMPKETGILVQIKGGLGTNVATTHLLELLPKEKKNIFDQSGKATVEMIKQEAKESALQVLERLGNARIDQLTMAIANDIGDHKGWIAWNARGKMDNGEQILDTLTQQSAIPQNEFSPQIMYKKEKKGGLTIYEPSEATLPIIIILRENEQLVIALGPNQEQLNPIKAELIKGMTAKKGEVVENLAKNEAMSKLIKQVDRTKAVWAVAGKISESIREELPLFKTVESATGTATLDKGNLVVNLQGNCKDEMSAKAEADQLNALIQAQLALMKQMSEERAEEMKPVAGILASVKSSADKNHLLVEGKVEVKTLEFALGNLVYLEIAMMHMFDEMQESGMEMRAATQKAETQPAAKEEIEVLPGQ